MANSSISLFDVTRIEGSFIFLFTQEIMASAFYSPLKSISISDLKNLKVGNPSISNNSANSFSTVASITASLIFDPDSYKKSAALENSGADLLQ